MWPLFDTPAFAPFVIAGFILIILLLVEIVGFLFGGLSGFLDNLVPDSLLEADFDADVDMDINSDISLGLKALDWLYVGRIPTMILLILFIGSFCISGIILQQISLLVLGHYISPWLASLDAFVISIPLLKVTAALLYPIFPKDETTAVSGDSLVGQSAKIVIGYASADKPAQAKTQDIHGQIHYIMVEPDPSFMIGYTEQDALTTAKRESTLPATDINSNKTIDMNGGNTIDINIDQSTYKITDEDTLVITKKIGDRYWVKKI